MNDSSRKLVHNRYSTNCSNTTIQFIWKFLFDGFDVDVGVVARNWYEKENNFYGDGWRFPWIECFTLKSILVIFFQFLIDCLNSCGKINRRDVYTLLHFVLVYSAFHNCVVDLFTNLSLFRLFFAVCICSWVANKAIFDTWKYRRSQWYQLI